MNNKIDLFKTFLLAVYLIQTPFDGGGQEIYLQAFSSLLVLLYWFITLTVEKKSSSTEGVRIPPNFIALIVFLFIAALSIVTSVDKSASSWVYFYWLNQAFFFLAVYNHLREQEIYNKILEKVIFPFSVIVSTWGLFEYIVGNPRNVDPLLGRGPSQAMFEQKNSTAGFLVIIIVILFSYYIIERERKKSRYVYLFLMLSTSALIGTYSRAGWVTLISCLVIYFLLLGKNHLQKYLKKLSTYIVGGSLVFIVMANMPGANLFLRVKLIVADNYLPYGISDRMDAWIAAWRLGADNPLLGTGIGTYHLTYLSQVELDRSFRIWTTHNDYLQFFSETGIFGSLSILVALGIYVWVGFKLARKFKASETFLTKEQLFIVGIFAASLAPLIHSIVDFDLRTPGVFALFLFISAYILHEAGINDVIKVKFRKASFKKLSRIPFNIIVSIITLGTLYFLTTTILADLYYKIAVDKELKEEFDGGIYYAQKASELKSGVSDYNAFLAKNYMRYAFTADEEKARNEFAYESENEYLLAIENSHMVPDYYLDLANLYQKKMILFSPARLKVEYLYHKAMSASPSNNSLKFRFAEALMKVGSYDTAIQTLEQSRKRGRNLTNGLTLLAEAYRLAGNLEKADSTLNLKLAEDPDDGFANFIKAEILEDMSRLDDAISHYLISLRKSDRANKFQVLLQLGKAYSTIKEYDTALIYLFEALKLNSGERNTLLTISKTFGAMGNSQQSAKYFNMAIE